MAAERQATVEGVVHRVQVSAGPRLVVTLVVVEDSLAGDMEIDLVAGLGRQVQDRSGLVVDVKDSRYNLGVDLVVAGCKDQEAVCLAVAGLVTRPFEGVEAILVAAVDGLA